MKYSLRSLMIVVLVVPPLLSLGWFRWKELSREEPQYEEIQGPYSICPSDTSPSPEDWVKATRDYTGTLGSLPNSSAPAPNPPKR